MRKIFNFIVCASFALLSAACSNQAEQSLEMAENEGVLALNIDFESTRAELDASAEFELKIYRYAADQEKELVRKYTSLTEVPQYIWLIKDNYCAQVKDKTTVEFTITPFLSLLAFTGAGNHDFVMTITDNDGNTTVKTLMIKTL